MTSKSIICLLVFVLVAVASNLVHGAAPICTGVNEVRNTCGSRCPITCANKNDTNPPICTADCVDGCFCVKGTYRDYDGVCRKKCTPPCPGINEVRKTCGSRCPITCANQDNPPICTADCVDGCFCVEGTIRDYDGVCREKCTPPCPGINEVRNTCGSRCPITCANQNNPPICTADCVDGCFCVKGTIRDYDGVCREKCTIKQ